MQSVYPPLERIGANARVRNMAEYEKMHKHSIEHNEEFWAEQAKDLDWFSDYKKVKHVRVLTNTLSFRLSPY
jgi:acetyl-CoA synthetase